MVNLCKGSHCVRAALEELKADRIGARLDVPLSVKSALLEQEQSASSDDPNTSQPKVNLG